MPIRISTTATTTAPEPASQSAMSSPARCRADRSPSSTMSWISRQPTAALPARPPDSPDPPIQPDERVQVAVADGEHGPLQSAPAGRRGLAGLGAVGTEDGDLPQAQADLAY